MNMGNGMLRQQRDKWKIVSETVINPGTDQANLMFTPTLYHNGGNLTNVISLLAKMLYFVRG